MKVVGLYLMLAWVALVIPRESFALSVDDSNKILDQYDNASQKILGFINCISRVLVGSDALTSSGPRSPKAVILPRSPDFPFCFEIAGFKTEGGFAKMLSIFKKSSANPSANPSSFNPINSNTTSELNGVSAENKPIDEAITQMKAANQDEIDRFVKANEAQIDEMKRKPARQPNKIQESSHQNRAQKPTKAKPKW